MNLKACASKDGYNEARVEDLQESVSVSQQQSMRILSFLAIVLLVAALAWLTMTDEDPCANPQSDISASVLADSEGDQDGLISRAIIMKANCEKQPAPKTDSE